MKTMRLLHKVSFSAAAIFLLVGGGLTQVIAQNRYSANVVGYHDADFVAGSNLVANPFDAGNNTLSNLFAGVPSGSYFLPWDPVNRTFGPANQFTTQGGWTDGGATLSVAQGGFLWLPAPKRISFVGEPWPPTCITFPMGDSVAGFMPQACCDWSAGGGQWNRDLTECVFQLPSDTVVEKWDRQGQHFRVYAFLGTEFGWYPDFDAPTLAPDEAAIFRSPLPFRAKYPGRYGPSPVQLFRPSRDGTNFVFQYFSWDGGIFSVQRSTSLSTGAWRTILTEAANPTNFVVTVTIPVEVNGAAFYRVHTLRLLNSSRAGSEFRFQFYAEEGVRYQVSRSASFTGAPWIPVLSIEGAGALVTAIDPAATATTAYYRLEY